MTPRQATSVLLTMYEAAHDARQKDALEIAITHLRDRLEIMDRQYMRGFHDGRRVGWTHETF